MVKILEAIDKVDLLHLIGFLSTVLVSALVFLTALKLIFGNYLLDLVCRWRGTSLRLQQRIELLEAVMVAEWKIRLKNTVEKIKGLPHPKGVLFIHSKSESYTEKFLPTYKGAVDIDWVRTNEEAIEKIQSNLGKFDIIVTSILWKPENREISAASKLMKDLEEFASSTSRKIPHVILFIKERHRGYKQASSAIKSGVDEDDVVTLETDVAERILFHLGSKCRQ